MEKKAKVILIYLAILIGAVLFFTPDASARLGISPAKIEMDFVPNFEKTIEFTVSSNNDNQEIQLYKKGGLEENVIINKRSIEGAGRFKATLKLPEEIEKPGNHRALIGAKEKIDKEIAGTVGTSLAVQAVIEVFVPYPGKYLEITNYEAKDVNAGEQTKFLLDVKNKGKQKITFDPRIEIFGKNGEKIQTLNMKKRTLDTTEKIKLQKFLNTTPYDPGEYQTRAVVDYEGKTTASNETLNIGRLFVNITDYKKTYTPGKIKEFMLEAESRWNEQIKNVYADIIIYKNRTETIEFRTSPANLEPWEVKNISGYFETQNMSLGKHKAIMNLKYEGETTSKEGEIIFRKKDKEKDLSTTVITIGIGILIVIIALIIYLWRKKKNEK